MADFAGWCVLNVIAAAAAAAAPPKLAGGGIATVDHVMFVLFGIL